MTQVETIANPGIYAVIPDDVALCLNAARQDGAAFANDTKFWLRTNLPDLNGAETAHYEKNCDTHGRDTAMAARMGLLLAGGILARMVDREAVTALQMRANINSHMFKGRLVLPAITNSVLELDRHIDSSMTVLADIKSPLSKRICSNGLEVCLGMLNVPVIAPLQRRNSGNSPARRIQQQIK